MKDLTTRHSMPPAVVAQIEAISDILAAGGSIDVGNGMALQGLPEQFATEHFIHAGVYSRTIHIPEARLLCGSFIRVPTIMCITGDLSLYNGEKWTRITGDNQLVCCEANRRGMGYAHALTHCTMLFATQSDSVKDAEQEFTEEWERLMPAKEV